MSEFLSDTPMVGRHVCPGCEPDLDVMAEVVDLRYCHHHEPVRAGDADTEVTQGWISGTQDAGGEDNRAWCDLLHRKKILRRPA